MASYLPPVSEEARKREEEIQARVAQNNAALGAARDAAQKAAAERAARVTAAKQVGTFDQTRADYNAANAGRNVMDEDGNIRPISSRGRLTPQEMAKGASVQYGPTSASQGTITTSNRFGDPVTVAPGQSVKGALASGPKAAQAAAEAKLQSTLAADAKNSTPESQAAVVDAYTAARPNSPAVVESRKATEAAKAAAAAKAAPATPQSVSTPRLPVGFPPAEPISAGEASISPSAGEANISPSAAAPSYLSGVMDAVKFSGSPTTGLSSLPKTGEQAAGLSALPSVPAPTEAASVSNVPGVEKYLSVGKDGRLSMIDKAVKTDSKGRALFDTYEDRLAWQEARRLFAKQEQKDIADRNKARQAEWQRSRLPR